MLQQHNPESRMSAQIDHLLKRISELYDEVDAELSRHRDAFRYTLKNGKVRFEEAAKRDHRKMRVRLTKFLSKTRPMVVLTAPFIYALIIPFVILDIFVSLYHAICFPAYGIPRVRRSDYIRVDRHHLQYLNGLQKLNCVYCGYCNGLIGWVREVASRTEAYWCPIKHADRIANPHPFYPHFTDFGDAEGFRSGLESVRDRVTGKANKE